MCVIFSACFSGPSYTTGLAVSFVEHEASSRTAPKKSSVYLKFIFQINKEGRQYASLLQLSCKCFYSLRALTVTVSSIQQASFFTSPVFHPAFCKSAAVGY